MMLKKIAILVLLMIAAFLTYSILNRSVFEEPSTKEQFGKDLTLAQDVFIVMDLRGAPEDSRVGVMQCGIDLAGSTALQPRNVFVYAVEGNTCLDENNTDVGAVYCDTLSTKGAVIQIRYGEKGLVEFYKNKMLVNLNNYSAPCSVSSN
ncbi:hypothetical protein KJ780_02080 [Candidatus Micrarchaeota archaeon]|nr:hypothetical protein [Candidatus Micrarchaeota archaeon]